MINLLPPNYKEESKSEENLTLVFILEILFLLFLITFALILFSIKIGLSSSVETQKIIFDAKNKEFSQIKSVEEQLNLLNKEFTSLDSFYKNQPDITGFLERISKLLPKGIYLNSFSYQKEGQKIEISGFSPTVELLLEFKNKLEEQNDLAEIYFPTNVWLRSADIDFNASMKINY